MRASDIVMLYALVVHASTDVSLSSSVRARVYRSPMHKRCQLSGCLMRTVLHGMQVFTAQWILVCA